MESTQIEMTDYELMDRLKFLAAQWFKNADILILEELFRRYNRAQAKRPPIE